MSKEKKELLYPDFTNTEIAFKNKSDKDLKETKKLFQVMNNGRLVDIGSGLAKCALKLRLPFVQPIMKRTIFKQFCGGVNLMDCQDVIDHLYACLLYTSPSPRDATLSRMPSSA